MAVLWINNEAMPSPSNMTVDIEDVGDASARNALGGRLVDRIAVKRAVKLEWARVTPAQLAAIMAAVTDDVFFTARFHDPLTGGLRQGEFRAVEKSARLYRATGGNAEWTEISMKWEER